MKIPYVLSRSFHKVGFELKKHSPEILLASGIIGGVTAAVMACKATTKVQDILEETKEQVDIIHDCMKSGDVVGESYSEEDGKKDLAIVYAQTGLKFVKLYGPSVGLGVLSVTSILASNNIMRKRNVALAAAYTAVDTGFKEYRARLVERFGEELDRELKYNVKTEKIQETVIDENGEEKTVERTITTANINEHSEYAKFYDDGCRGWTKDPHLNLMQLRRIQDWCNERLQSRGFMFLNEVYSELGIPKTEAGQSIGWIYNPKDPSCHNFIDFGIYDYDDPRKRDFVNGYERVILLDFNVDGNIMKRFVKNQFTY